MGVLTFREGFPFAFQPEAFMMDTEDELEEDERNQTEVDAQLEALLSPVNDHMTFTALEVST
jgi:hypothetical protein